MNNEHCNSKIERFFLLDVWSKVLSIFRTIFSNLIITLKVKLMYSDVSRMEFNGAISFLTQKYLNRNLIFLVLNIAFIFYSSSGL